MHAARGASFGGVRNDDRRIAPHPGAVHIELSCRRTGAAPSPRRTAADSFVSPPAPVTPSSRSQRRYRTDSLSARTCSSRRRSSGMRGRPLAVHDRLILTENLVVARRDPGASAVLVVVGGGEHPKEGPVILDRGHRHEMRESPLVAELLRKVGHQRARAPERVGAPHRHPAVIPSRLEHLNRAGGRNPSDDCRTRIHRSLRGSPSWPSMASCTERKNG